MIPVVDLAEYNLSVEEKTTDTATLKDLAGQICQAFQTVGFVYLKNHGIPQELVLRAFSTSKAFFDQPVEKKKKYSIKQGEYSGWIGYEEEKVNHDRPVCDAREGFALSIWNDMSFPENVPQEIELASKEMFQSCSQLALRILELLSIGLNKDPDYLRQYHKKMGHKGNVTMYRSNYYPPLKELKPDQARCGEHSDYGTVTFLFQDNASGLEAKGPDGEYVPVPPMEGTIVMNLGDMMQRWSADKLKATKHRVMASPDSVSRLRQSISFFVVPDDDALISCLDGSNRYPDITCVDYIKKNFNANLKDFSEK
uniref:UPF0676 protein C1494.01-like n=1 Tax=Crassostrea virginica TaxID=6565 RepID=A0A8B8E6K4_CRAVI|nr:UPF0676 protein C1494.01-like [Crassostrea virginica]XP_022335778.1 UPF0676 protein C1494.01-like [Crassostrea virginica]XP_022335785.1 UPF0676 protein C1494.01-like [Crassostrea virginica]